MINLKYELYDSPRDAEQAAGVSFSAEDRVKIAKISSALGIPFVELGFPSGPNGPEVMKAFKELRRTDLRTNLVSFGSTSRHENPAEDPNLKALLKTGTEYVAIVGKSDLDHVEKQLRISPADNLRRIRHSTEFLSGKRRKVVFDAEHFYDGFKRDMGYAIEVLEAAAKSGAHRLVLCDTNGGTLPDDIREITRKTYETLAAKKIDTPLGVHFHNDSGFAVANALGVLPYVKQIQGTLSGFGERVGNLNLTTLIGALDKIGIRHGIKTRSLRRANEDLCRLAGVELPMNRPYVGYTAFAHKGGIHTDGVFAKKVSYEHTKPERWGNKSRVLMSHLGGFSAIKAAAEQFGIEIDRHDSVAKRDIHRLQKVLAERQRDGRKAEQSTAENYLLLAEHMLHQPKLFQVTGRHFETGDLTGQEESRAYMELDIGRAKVRKRLEVPGGPIDASLRLLKRELVPYFPELRRVHLDDFSVSIARRDEERSTVRTEIVFKYDGQRFRTVGVNPNILFSGTEALVNGLRYVALRHRYGTRKL